MRTSLLTGWAAGLPAFAFLAGPALARQLPPPMVRVHSMAPQPMPMVNALPGRVEGAPVYGSGPAMAEMERLAETERLAGELPQGCAHEWTGQSLEKIQAESRAAMPYAMNTIFVFLLLSGLYESWSIPLSVMLVAPLGVLGCVIAVLPRDMSNGSYFKVGLIVEFARNLREQGQSRIKAVLAIVFVPAFFVLVLGLFSRITGGQATKTGSAG